MEKATQYEIADSDSVPDLLADGWQLYGDPFATVVDGHIEFWQAVIRHNSVVGSRDEARINEHEMWGPEGRPF